MHIRTLTETPLTEITACFNSAFSDYLVPLQLTPGQMQHKMLNDNIDLDISAGVFDGNKLLGFILNGTGYFNGKKTAYNGGTGVIPDKRGLAYTRKMYEFITPILKLNNFEQCSLEVIDTNAAAIHSYQNTGFKISRKFTCFKGSIKIADTFNTSEIKDLKDRNWSYLRSFWNWIPSWPNSVEAIERSWPKLKSIAIERENQLVAYLIYNPDTARVSQFAVKKDFRNQGLGNQLFNNLNKVLKKEITIINVDSSDKASIHFLESIGLKPYIGQYEMILSLKPDPLG